MKGRVGPAPPRLIPAHLSVEPVIMAGMTDFSIPAPVLDVASEIDEIAAAIRRILESSPQWSIDSRAREQMDEEGQYSGPSSLFPIKHALLTGTAALGMTADHLAAIAGCLRTPRVVYAPLALARPVLSSAATALYLLEDSISTRERLRRSWTLHLAAYTEQLAMSRSAGDELERIANSKREDIRDLAQAAGMHVTSPPWRRGGPGKRQPTPPAWVIEHEPMPTEGKLIAAAYDSAADPDGAALSWSVFRGTSAFVHASPAALEMMLIEPVGRSEAGVVHARLGIALTTTVTFLGCVVLAVKAAADSAMRLLGQHDPWWSNGLLTIMVRWRQIMESAAPRQRHPLLLAPGELARSLGLVLPDRR